MSVSAAHTYRARLLFTGDGSVRQDAYVTVAGDRVMQINGAARREPFTDLGDVALLPGLVNCHTHLEFSDLAQPLGRLGQSLPQWIAAVVRQRRERASGGAAPEAAVARGLMECAATGTVLLGEIATVAWSPPPNVPPNLQVVVFRELLGLAADRLAPLLDDARDHLLSAGDKTTDWRAALSPHAPYTVSQPLLVAAVELARQHRIPLAMHVAESAQEVELLAGRSGPLRELLESLGAWQPEKLWGTCPRDYLALLAQAPRTLVIHGNYLPPDDWQFLAERRSSMSVIFCPRTHAYFDHSRYPLDPMLRAGVQLAIGTDSRASNPDLSLFEEMRFIAQRYPEIAPAEILRLGTSHGAHAMGYETEYGQLRAGTRLPLTLAELTATDGDAYEQLWRAAKVGRFHPV